MGMLPPYHSRWKINDITLCSVPRANLSAQRAAYSQGITPPPTYVAALLTHGLRHGACSPRTFPQDQAKGLGARSLFRNWLGSLNRASEPGKDGSMVNGPKGAPDTRPRKTLGGPPGCHGCQGLRPGLKPSTESCHSPQLCMQAATVLPGAQGGAWEIIGTVGLIQRSR